MKITYRIPTKDQYAFVEVQKEVQNGITEEELTYEYQNLFESLNSEEGSGLAAKQWNAWLDGYLKGKAGSVEEWEQMDEFQKRCINEIKKSQKRTNEK